MPCARATRCLPTNEVSWLLTTGGVYFILGICGIHVFIYVRCWYSYDQALALFQEAINLAQVTQTSEIAWASTYVNLGTCYRKLEYVFDTIISLSSPLTECCLHFGPHCIHFLSSCRFNLNFELGCCSSPMKSSGRCQKNVQACLATRPPECDCAGFSRDRSPHARRD